MRLKVSDGMVLWKLNDKNNVCLKGDLTAQEGI
jgi:hypothetical protein